jgi:integrase/recombinase XerD
MDTILAALEPDRRTPVATGPTDDDALLITSWLRGRPASTVRAYVAALNAFMAELGYKPLRAVTLTDLQSHADALEGAGLKDATRARRMASLKSLFRFGAETGYLTFNPARALQPSRVFDDLAERILPEETIAAILAAEPAPVRRLLLRLAYASGGRVSELVGLRWADCLAHGDGGQVNFMRAKGAKTRSVRVPAPVWMELQARRPADGEGFVFATTRRDNSPISPVTAWRWVTAAGRRVGVKLSPHWFRHAHASHALDHGAPVHLVMKTLGHASMSTTSRYAHARPGESSGDYLDLADPEPK